MRKTTIYLASAIDRADPGQSLYESVRKALSQSGSRLQSGFVVYDPKKAFTVDSSLLTGEHSDFSDAAARFVYGVNQRAFEAADVRVFVVDGSPSFGVPIEMKEAVEKALPFAVAVWADIPMPVYLRTMLQMVGAQIAPLSKNELVCILYDGLRETETRKCNIWYSGGRYED